MSLSQLLQTPSLLTDLQPSILEHSLRRNGMPPLNPEKLSLGVYVGQTRTAVRAATGGDATFLLRYKGREGALLCLEEQEEGTQWNVLQVKGADSKVSYRISTSFDVYGFMGKLIKNVIDDTRTGVALLTMPVFSDIEGLDQLPDYRLERVREHYARFRTFAGLRLQEGQNRYRYAAAQNDKMAS